MEDGRYSEGLILISKGEEELLLKFFEDNPTLNRKEMENGIYLKRKRYILINVIFLIPAFIFIAFLILISMYITKK